MIPRNREFLRGSYGRKLLGLNTQDFRIRATNAYRTTDEMDRYSQIHTATACIPLQLMQLIQRFDALRESRGGYVYNALGVLRTVYSIE